MKAKVAPDVQAAGSTRVEFEVTFSRGPKGRRRVREANAADAGRPISSPVPAEAVRPLPRAALDPAGPVPATAPPLTPTSQRPHTPAPTPGAGSPPLPGPEHVPNVTRLLVLGHHFERLVRDGKVKDYAEIARLTGLSRARVTQIVNLTLLAPAIQESILAEVSEEGLQAERALRPLRDAAERER